jgi:hypothetical protein
MALVISLSKWLGGEGPQRKRKIRFSEMISPKIKDGQTVSDK